MTSRGRVACCLAAVGLWVLTWSPLLLKMAVRPSDEPLDWRRRSLARWARRGGAGDAQEDERNPLPYTIAVADEELDDLLARLALPSKRGRTPAMAGNQHVAPHR